MIASLHQVDSLIDLPTALQSLKSPALDVVAMTSRNLASLSSDGETYIYVHHHVREQPAAVWLHQHARTGNVSHSHCNAWSRPHWRWPF